MSAEDDLRDLKELARVALDIAVGSMDFGSGFLDREEVDGLRSLAVLLGVDPKAVTPVNMMCDYYPPHEWKQWPQGYGGGSEFCTKCRQIR